MKTAIEIVLEERKRQIEVEGWTPEHDDEHTGNELAYAAISYALPVEESKELYWPWHPKWLKPSPNNRIKELAKAGALILAEIERIKRAENDDKI